MNDATRIKKWQAMIEGATAILGDTVPHGVTSTGDTLMFSIAMKDFRRLFSGKSASRRRNSDWTHWTITVDGVEFTACEKLSAAETQGETVTV